MPPTALRPCLAWMRRNSLAAWFSASSQLTVRQGSSMVLRIIGVVMRSGWLA